MSNNVKNIKKSLGNTVSAATSVVSVSTEVVADASGLISSSIEVAPAVLKALLLLPFSVAKGYLMKAKGLSDEDAEAVVFHYLKQDVVTTIKQGGEASGRLIANIFEQEVEEATDAAKKQA